MNPGMHFRGLLLLAMISAQPARAGEPPEAVFETARTAFAAADYRRAAQLLEGLVAAAPGDDRYVHWLGKAYGRQAERAGWFEALRLAKLTRKALEKAVALNPDNRPAVEDLARYYAEAPGFLGGDADKAARLRARLQVLPAPP